MEKLYKELEDVKIEKEKITADYRIKADLFENLRKIHNEQLVQLKEAKLEIERQLEEINVKTEEILVTKKMYEDVKKSLNEKESVLTHLSSSSEKLKTDYGEKLQKLEAENKDLLGALDEANAKSIDHEQKIEKYIEEIESLKARLNVSQKKCLEVEQRGNESKEQKLDMFMEVAEENGKLKDQLKWKREQFKHLEEAHDKIQEQFRVSKKESEKEKSILVNEISSLQSSLDSQTRISESLQVRLEMCNQALAHEQTRRKLLEVQVSESRACYEKVYADYQEAKSKIESLMTRREEEVASLRTSLGTKQTLCKEMEYKIRLLEEENRELKESLKEQREAQIQESGAASSLSMLRIKLRNLEQVHKECYENMKLREAEWSSQLEKIAKDLTNQRSELDCKDKQLQELQMNLEDYHSTMLKLKLDYEEMSVSLMVYKSGYSDAHSDFSNSKVGKEMNNSQTDIRVADLIEQLEQKNSSLAKAFNEIEKSREIILSLEKKIESLNGIDQQCILMQKELQRCKGLLEESFQQHLHLKKQASYMENSVREDLGKVSDALDEANKELQERTSEESETGFELDGWKSVAERLKACLKENHESRKEMEDSLLAHIEMQQMLEQENGSLIRKAEEKDKIVDDLQQQVVLLQNELERETMALAEMEARNISEQEKEGILLQTLDEKEKNICNLQQQIACLENDFMAREFEAAVLTQTKEQDRDRLLLVIREKTQLIEDLSYRIMSIHEAWKKITEVATVGELQIKLKSLIIVEMEGEINNLRNKLDFQAKSLSCSKQKEEHIQLETKKVIGQLENQLRTSKAITEKLEAEKELLFDELMKLKSVKKDLIDYIDELSDQVNEFSDKDTELMSKLDKIIHGVYRENELATDLKADEDELYDMNTENVNPKFSSSGKKIKAREISKRTKLTNAHLPDLFRNLNVPDM